MNIVNFTPITALTGGLLIGLSVALFFILKGRMIGISGIASNFLISKDNRIDNFLFLVGLILGPLIYLVSTEWALLFAGLIGGTVAFLFGEKNGK